MFFTIPFEIRHLIYLNLPLDDLLTFRLVSKQSYIDTTPKRIRQLRGKTVYPENKEILTVDTEHYELNFNKFFTDDLLIRLYAKNNEAQINFLLNLGIVFTSSDSIKNRIYEFLNDKDKERNTEYNFFSVEELILFNSKHYETIIKFFTVNKDILTIKTFFDLCGNLSKHTKFNYRCTNPPTYISPERLQNLIILITKLHPDFLCPKKSDIDEYSMHSDVNGCVADYLIRNLIEYKDYVYETQIQQQIALNETTNCAK